MIKRLMRSDSPQKVIINTPPNKEKFK